MTLIRLHIIAEGQTEERFVKTLLMNHLGEHNISVDVRCVENSRTKSKIFRGGISNYIIAKKDIKCWMKEDKDRLCFFTTMFDLYALPMDFPGFQNAKTEGDSYKRVSVLEEYFKNDIKDRRFIPYIQLHEFEALILSDPSKFAHQFIKQDHAISNLVALCVQYISPELIDDGHDTAPSKRIITEIPEYKGRKPSAGPLIAKEIGLDVIRKKCPHFNDWLSRIERLSK